MSEVQQLLNEIGKELGRSEAQMKQYVDILEGEWYDTVESLKPISDVQWQTFGLPGRLVDAIKLRVHGAPQAAEPVAPAQISPPPPSNPAPVSTSASSSATVKKSSTVELAPTGDTLSKTFDEIVAIFATSIPQENDEMEIAIQTLTKLTDGVFANPENEKTRKIRKANPAFFDKCGKHASCIEYLNALGFKTEDEFLVMPVVYQSRLADGRGALTRFAKDANINLPNAPGVFNPYVASSTAMAAQPANAVAKRAKEAEEIKKEVEDKKKALASQGDNIKESQLAPPRVFWQASMSRLEDAIKQAQELAYTEDADSALLLDSMKCLQTSESTKFHSKQKEELEQLRKQKVFDISILRVTLPNKIVLELSLKPKTMWQDVYAKVESCLTEQAKFIQWYLYQTPPVQKFQRNKETLLKHKLVPGAVVFLGVDNREQDIPKMGRIINDTLFATLGPEPRPVTPGGSIPPRGTSAAASALLKKMDAAASKVKGYGNKKEKKEKKEEKYLEFYGFETYTKSQVACIDVGSFT